MVHQPLGKGETDQCLLNALQGKRLLLTICGHGHNPDVLRWGGSPMVMGGAVSYAWHGWVPPPPDPRGYVIYRLENDAVEFAYQDWAADRSFTVLDPAWGKSLSGKQTISGVVSDFDGTLDGLVCRLADRTSRAQLTHVGHLGDRFQAVLDCSGLPDGVYDLTLEATAGTRRSSQTRPLVVLNNRPQPQPGHAAAKLRFRLWAKPGEQGEVVFNGLMLGRFEGVKKSMQELTFSLPEPQLRRLNTVVFRTRQAAPIQAAGIRIEMDGRIFRDVRFAPGVKRSLGAPAGTAAEKADCYIDLRYRGERGS
jgi:hypothetical protein